MERKDTIYSDLKTGNFVTSPNDVFTIHTSNCISNSISIHLTNADESIYFALPNEIAAWKFLKRLNEMGGRKVLHKTDDNSAIPFVDSAPYNYRFVKGN